MASSSDANSTARLLWQPSQQLRSGCRLSDYARWLEGRLGRRFSEYDELWDWSVTEVEAFWQSIADYFDVRFHQPPQTVLRERVMPGAQWFTGGTLNYAEHALRADGARTALIAVTENGSRVEWTYRQLAEQVARARTGLAALGVTRGDRVVGLVPNGAEAVATMLATVSLGAIWSSCPPEFGPASVLDRFRQIDPKLMLTTGEYRYGGKLFRCAEKVREIVSGLPSLEQVVWLGSEPPDGKGLSYADLTCDGGVLEFDAVPFDHPMWILYSSGTTGLPKPIVHGHGGILLEHLKQLALHTDLGPDDRFFWFSTTGWMMWNYLVSGLLVGSSIVLYDGSPGHPDLLRLFRLAAAEHITYLGVSAPFIMACRKAGIQPARELELSCLRGVGSTGAPLPAEGFVWVHDEVGPHVWLGSLSGGTDLCTGFVGPCPWLAVRAGEIQCRSLGAKVEAFDNSGKALVDEVGELVISQPMPSMPVSFWGDARGERYRQSYFADYPGVWRHGDWIEIRQSGACVIYGRSDSTLNRGGIRMGTSEFYRVVEALPEIVDSVVVDTAALGEAGKLWLFVVLEAGRAMDEKLIIRIGSAIRRELSPRHVPDEIRAIREVPITLSGKKLEVPIKRVLTGTPLGEALNLGTLRNPDSVAALLEATR